MRPVLESLIAYRGTPRYEKLPEARRYPCIFFTEFFDYAADYAAGTASRSDEGFVAEYDLGQQRILHLTLDWEEVKDLIFDILCEDVRDLEVAEMYFYNPRSRWVRGLRERDYTGLAWETTKGNEICLFDVSGITKLQEWKVRWNRRTKSWDRVVFSA